MQSTLSRTVDGRMPYFAALDGVRAYCILLVMFDHLKSGGHTIRWLNGHLGVDLFFIISGFLITTLLRREQYLTGTVDFSSFFWRRIFRILPVYSVVLALYVAICHLPSQADRWVQLKSGLPYFLTFMNEFAHELNSGNVFTHTWSLGVEEKFYLVWPVLFFWIARSNWARRFIVAALFALIAIRAVLVHGHLVQAYFGLLMGCSMAIVLSGPHAGRIFNWLRRVPPSLALLLFLASLYATHLSKDFIPFFSGASVILLSSLLARDSWLKRLHTAPAMVWVGRRSYAMYLVHVLCLNAVEAKISITSGARAAAALAVAFCLAAAMAEVLYRFVEQPARSCGRAFLLRRNEIPAAI